MGWTSDEGTNFSSISGGYSYEPNASSQQLYFRAETPMDLRGKVLTLTYSASSDYKGSGANLQPFIQSLSENGSPGEWCWIGNADVSTTEVEVSCVIPDEPDWNITDDTGFKAGMHTNGDTVTGSVSVTKAVLADPPEPSSTVNVDMENSWRGNNSGAIEYVANGVELTPTVEGGGAVFDVVSPVNFNSATIEYEFTVDSTYLDAGYSLQAFIQEKSVWAGEFSNGWIDNSVLSSGTFTYTIPASGWNIAHDAGVQVGIQAPGDSGATREGSVVIHSVTINYAE
ncbi:family 15 carbohydrate-binding domain-containing protein [Gilvimarinus xylanilyticus]|uniref:Family 15 carbohydrate-binding domain-containing protein n=1 Tax=Gilvimarinus xylanilyticus TaxID=2944139 RepID=A0A9X2I2N5_9GAMM|nr:family 15 carbohydrate-binding domain-containing protein [Gilvimarinus xylanilyticus]MCP8899708.1 family 15 carbohydrate-binding domain-containing protein [Gilvimarinus xylanilyticus]